MYIKININPLHQQFFTIQQVWGGGGGVIRGLYPSRIVDMGENIWKLSEFTLKPFKQINIEKK